MLNKKNINASNKDMFLKQTQQYIYIYIYVCVFQRLYDVHSTCIMHKADVTFQQVI